MSTESASIDRMTGETATTTTSTERADAPPRRRGYGALWASAPREFGFLILTMPIAITGLVVLSTVFFTGLGLVAIVVGIFLMVASFYIARGFGTLELIRLRWAGRPEIRQPNWARGGREQGFWRSMFMPFIDGHYWLYVLHTLVVNPIVSVVTWSITVAWTSVALAGTTGWIWQPFIPDDDRTFWLNEWLFDRFFPGADLAYDPVVGCGVRLDLAPVEQVYCTEWWDPCTGEVEPFDWCLRPLPPGSAPPAAHDRRVGTRAA